MTRTNLLTLAAALLILGGLAGGEATGDESPVATATEDAKPAFVSASGKGSGPFRIDYAIIGTPVVGSPLALDLQIHSALGPGPVEISYQVADPSAIAFHEAQPEALLTELAANEPFVSERVTIIPQREGRLFLNVSAAVDTEEGRISTVTSIPIHVGEVSTAPSPQGVLETDEEGEAVRVLSGD
jgi:hypothetical protein